jgi:hypothetical protein
MMLIHPLAPLVVVHGEHGPAALLDGQGGEKSVGRFANRVRRNAGGTDRKQSLLWSSVGGDAFERLGQPIALVIRGHFAKPLRGAWGLLRKKRA